MPDKKIPHFPNWIKPDQKGDLKFIQVYIRGEPFFEAVGDNSYHSDALYDILDRAGLEVEWTEIDRVRLPSPAREGVYELVGAGVMVNLHEDGFMLSGYSLDYDHLKPNQKHLDDLTRGGHIPAGIKLTIMAP